MFSKSVHPASFGKDKVKISLYQHNSMRKERLMQSKRDKVKALRMKLKDKRQRKHSVIRTYLDLQDLHDLGMFIQHLTQANKLLTQIGLKTNSESTKKGTKNDPNKNKTMKATGAKTKGSAMHCVIPVFTIPTKERVPIQKKRYVAGMADVLELGDKSDDDFSSSLDHQFNNLGPDAVPSLEQYLQGLKDQNNVPATSTMITKASCVAVTPEKAIQEHFHLSKQAVKEAQVHSLEASLPGPGKLPKNLPDSPRSLPSSMDLSIELVPARSQLQNELKMTTKVPLEQKLCPKQDSPEVLSVRTCASPFIEAQGPVLFKDKALPSGRPNTRLGDQIARPEGQMASTFKPSPTSSPGAVPSACPGPPIATRFRHTWPLTTRLVVAYSATLTQSLVCQPTVGFSRTLVPFVPTPFGAAQPQPQP